MYMARRQCYELYAIDGVQGRVQLVAVLAAGVACAICKSTGTIAQDCKSAVQEE